MGIFRSKIAESFRSVMPIAVIVLLLSISLTPLSPGTMLLFLLGTICLVMGMAVFNVGAEMSMQVLGDKIGASMAQSKRTWLACSIGFALGTVITMSEPDLQILAEQVAGIDNFVLILTVSLGVGVFMAIAIARILFHIPLSVLLWIFYVGAFILCCFFVDKSFWAMAFDSGGVTTGPMTVPFIMAFGAGLSGIRAGKSSRDDSFGMVALCSVGPIIAVMVLGICYSVTGGTYTPSAQVAVETTRAGAWYYLCELGVYIKDVAVALLPILVFTVLYQLLTRSFGKTQMIRIGVGILYTFAGLVVFLTGANAGLMPVGTALGQQLATMNDGWLLLPVGVVLGFFIVKAEPSVYVLNKQVERISAGSVSARSMGISLSVGVSLAVGLSMVRILTGINIMWVLVPGYAVTLLLTLLVPPFFTGIAFDSGGVASGVMMSAFVLPMAISACVAFGGDVFAEAFGCVAFVAMTPVLSVQICGLIYRRKSKAAVARFVAEQEEFIDYTLPMEVRPI